MIKLVMPLELMTTHALTFQLSGTLVSGCVHPLLLLVH